MTFDLEAQVRRRTRRVVGVAVAVVVVTVVGAVTAVLALGGDRDPATPGAAGASSSAPTSTGAAPSTESSGAAPSTESSGAADSDELGVVSWAEVRGMALPVSRRNGPASTAAGRAATFAHNRAGALLAAAHIAVRADAVVGPAVYRPTISEQVTGTGTDELLANVDSDYEQRRARAGIASGQPLPETHAELAGYRIDSYTDTAAFLRLLIASPGPSGQGTVYIDFRLEVRWAGQDWRLIAPPGGEWRNATAQTPSTDGYTRFPGGR